MNIVILKGNVGQDARITNFDNGGKVAQFSLATTKRGYKKEDGTEVPEKTEWHNLVIRKSGLAGVAEKFVKKGTPVLVRGELHTRTYQDQEGNDRYVTEVVVEDMELCGGKRAEAAPAPTPDDGGYADLYDSMVGQNDLP